MGKKAIAALVKFLERLRTAVQEAGAWKKLHNRLASRLARICKCLGIARVSLYTLRHVGMATAKSWMAPEEVAASAGHASVHTAMTHYAKRRTGWVGLRLAGRPSPASVARVRGAAQVFRPSGQTMCQWK
jgi:integrase